MNRDTGEDSKAVKEQAIPCCWVIRFEAQTGRKRGGEVSQGQLMWTLPSRFSSLDLTMQEMVPCPGGFLQCGVTWSALGLRCIVPHKGSHVQVDGRDQGV